MWYFMIRSWFMDQWREISGFTKIRDTIKGRKGGGLWWNKGHINVCLQGKNMYRSLKTSSGRWWSEEEVQVEKLQNLKFSSFIFLFFFPVFPLPVSTRRDEAVANLGNVPKLTSWWTAAPICRRGPSASFNKYWNLPMLTITIILIIKIN